MFKEADRTHPRYYPVLGREILRLKKILTHGIPECYSSFFEYLCDWGADFSWTVEAGVLQYQDLLDSEEWVRLAAQVKEKRGYDFVEAMVEDLSAIWSGEF